MPEKAVLELPAQTLYLAVSQSGLASATDLLNICSPKQLRLLLDFDCWVQDSFSEEHFWEWLNLADEENGLTFLLKILKSIDLKLIGLLVARHVTLLTNEEPTENPPEVGFYTPDKGYTWLRVNLENELHHFLLTRFLAVVFETSAEVFYQILAIPSISTPSMLEEDSFQEKNARLSEEGIPDRELAVEFQTPLSPTALHEKAAAGQEGVVVEAVRIVSPLLYDGGLSTQLERLLAEAVHPELLEAELTLLLNTALVFWGISLRDREQYALICEQVKGACEIGLETLSEMGLSASLGETLSLTDAYRLGLHVIFSLKISLRTIRTEERTLTEQHFLTGLKERFPCVPEWFNTAAEEHDNSLWSEDTSVQAATLLKTPYRALNSMADVEAVRTFLEQLKPV